MGKELEITTSLKEAALLQVRAKLAEVSSSNLGQQMGSRREPTRLKSARGLFEVSMREVP
jgi:hypothetical protein